MCGRSLTFRRPLSFWRATPDLSNRDDSLVGKTGEAQTERSPIAEGHRPSAHLAAKPRTSLTAASLKSGRGVLGLFRRSFGIEGDIDELLCYRLRVTIIAAGL